MDAFERTPTEPSSSESFGAPRLMIAEDTSSGLFADDHSALPVPSSAPVLHRVAEQYAPLDPEVLYAALDPLRPQDFYSADQPWNGSVYHMQPQQNYVFPPPGFVSVAAFPSVGSWMQPPFSLPQHYVDYGASMDSAGDASAHGFELAEQGFGAPEVPLAEPPGVPAVASEPVENKAMADFACQRFRKTKKPANTSEESGAKRSRAKRKTTAAVGDANLAASGSSELQLASGPLSASEDVDGGEDEDVVKGLNIKSKEGTAALPESDDLVESAGAAVEAEEEETPIDEAEQAEADEFYSQLIDWPLAADTIQTGGGDAGTRAGRNTSAKKKRLRWSEEESELFRHCARLYDTNYFMIQELLPHRSIVDIKKHYDKQRSLYPLMFSDFSMRPRFESVEEYHQLRAELEEEKRDFENTMRELEIAPWGDLITNPAEGSEAGLAMVEEERQSLASSGETLYTLAKTSRRQR